MTLAEEIADLLRPAGRAIARARARIVVGVGVVITLLCAFAVLGAAVDDLAIGRHLGVAQADVLDGSTFFRTLVRFTDSSGAVVVPANGVAYPRGIAPGATVTVEYDLSDPDRVRISGRNAWSGAWPFLAVIVVTWAALVPLARRMRVNRPPTS